MLVPLLAAAAALLLAVLYRRLHYMRFQQYAHFPQHAPSLLLGHLGVVDAFIRKEPPRGHADVAFTAMHEALGRPAVLLVDLRPVSSCMVIVCSHEVAEQVLRPTDRWPHTPPRGPEFWESMKPLTGPTSILAAHGEQWRALRKRFNPGFAPQHLVTLLPAILDKVSLCLGQLDTHARAGEDFSLQHMATNLTLDITGRVVLDFDMDAQTAAPTPFMRDFRALVETYTSDHLDIPWWCTPRTQLRRRQLSKRIWTTLRAMVRARHADAHGLRDIKTLTPELVDAMYELARTPRALAAVRAELDELFGADATPAAVRDRLLAPGGDELVHRIAYTFAVLKETLWLWPPESTMRMTRPGDGWAVRDPGTGEMLNLDGLLVYQLVPII
ncbi:cytochrome P450 [Lasiosphaeria miniovina]|uniref:Cytochrome P450 n=1 Tax=Lasiosphaeria miniovina TaxID=1954250 RepID=A0AA40ALH3_9PEZI|nr:cytochrome P450 [Lasiosphaeria miniovina]KAK0718048.1 cytochrome P450 [Lasiosphaeria miniovina]